MKLVIFKICFEILIIIVLLSTRYTLATTTSNSVVAVYGVMQDDRTSQGSGFFISADGRIMTAYHVIFGAKKIYIIDDKNFYKDVKIESIAPSYDLAILKVNSKTSCPFLKFSNELTLNSGSQVKIYGWPRNMPNFSFTGNIIHEGFLNSNMVKDASGNRIFNSGVNLLMIGIEAYNGMSGGPVLYNGLVIGVVNGSFSEPEQMAWAIPINYYNEVYSIEKYPSQLSSWPSFNMISGVNWSELRHWYLYDLEAETLFNNYIYLLDQIRQLRIQKVKIAYDLQTIISKHNNIWEIYKNYYFKKNLTESQNQLVKTLYDSEYQIVKKLFDCDTKAIRVYREIYNISKEVKNTLKHSEKGQKDDSYNKQMLYLKNELENSIGQFIGVIDPYIELINKLGELNKTSTQLIQEMSTYPHGSYNLELIVDKFVEVQKEILANYELLCTSATNGTDYIDYAVSTWNIQKSILEIEVFHNR